MSDQHDSRGENAAVRVAPLLTVPERPVAWELQTDSQVVDLGVTEVNATFGDVHMSGAAWAAWIPGEG